MNTTQSLDFGSQSPTRWSDLQNGQGSPAFAKVSRTLIGVATRFGSDVSAGLSAELRPEPKSLVLADEDKILSHKTSCD